MNVKQTARFLLDVRDDNRKRPVLSAGEISYANWWNMNPEDYWFTRFVRHHFPEYTGKQDESFKPIRFYSVFGPGRTSGERFDGGKIFFSGENLEEYVKYERLPVREVSDRVWHVRKRKFDHYGLRDVSLSMGFPYPERISEIAKADGFSVINEEPSKDGMKDGVVRFRKGEKEISYLRFPLWIQYLFEPEDGPEEIGRRIEMINRTVNPVSCRGTACIASHDFYGTRQVICDDLEKNGIPVQYPGKWRHNTEVLKNQYGDDKLAYLQSVRFNICPENTDTPGYVTEKLFDAFRTGVIPIYHGSCNDPEPGLICRDSVLFWDYQGDNSKTIQEIRRLSENNRVYEEFIHQKKLSEECVPYVWNRMVSLRKEIERILSRCS